MKPSVYNVVVEIKKYNQFLLFNTFSGTLLEAENDVGHLLKTFADAKSIPTTEMEKLGSERLQMLIDGGFLVNDMTDEVAKVKKLDLARFPMIRASYQNSLSLTLLPSIRCNFDCFYCFEPAFLRNAPARESSYMSAEIQNKICKYVEKTLDKPALQYIKTTWYGGEPLLYPEIVAHLQSRINQIAVERGKETSSSIVTNGFCLTTDMSDMLVENGIDKAQITLDGPAAIHNKRRRLYRGDKDTNFETIMKNIKDANPNLKINIRVNVGRHNQQAIYDLLDELIEHGVWPRDQVSIYLASLTGGKDVLKRREYLAVNDAFRVHLVKKYNDFSKHPKAKLKFDLPSGQNLPVCGHIMDEDLTWLVDCVGDVYRCWDTPGQQQYRVGTIDDLLKNKIKDLKEWILNEEIREETGCYKCRMSPVCTIACPVHYFMARESGKYQAGEYYDKNEDGNPFCSNWKFGIEQTLATQYEFYREFPELVYNFPPKQNNNISGLLQITEE